MVFREGDMIFFGIKEKRDIKTMTGLAKEKELNIYIYLFIKLQPSPTSAGSARIMPRNELQ